MYILFDSSWIRAILRIYFVIVLLLVAWIGDKCLHQRIKLKLLRGEQVQVTSMTGWLRGPTFMKVALQMRRLPGGIIGVFMVMTAALALLSDLAVSGFVRIVMLQSRCPFYSGMRIDQTPAQYPSNVGTPALWAVNAQAQSFINGGLFGIYTMTSDWGNFSAEAVDVAGNWSCTAGSTVSYTVPEWSDIAIARDLVDKGVLYGGVYNAANWSEANSAYSNQTVIMSVDAKGSSIDPSYSDVKPGLWNARFAVTIQDSQYSKLFQIFSCVLQDYSSGTVSNVVSKIDIGSSVFGQWLRSIQGKLWDDFDSDTPVTDVALFLSLMLNAMTMVSGSTNRVTYALPAGTDQGCIEGYTTIPWPVTLCFAFATFLLAFFTLYFFYLFIKVHTESRRYDRGNANITTPGGTPVPSSEIRKNTPNGLLDWMQHAVHESGNTEKMPSTHHLSKWHFSTRHHGGRRLGVVSKHMSMTTVNNYFASQTQPQAQTPGSVNSRTSLLSPQTPEMPGQLWGGLPAPSPNGSSYFPAAARTPSVPRKPVPSAEYDFSNFGYQQVPRGEGA